MIEGGRVFYNALVRSDCFDYFLLSVFSSKNRLIN